MGDNRFGTSLDTDGDVIVFGAFLDPSVAVESGSAYVYRLVGQQWIEEQKLSAPDGADYDAFGWRVAVDGDVVAVGAIGDDPAADWIRRDGAVYIYRHDGSSWVFEQKVVPADLDIGDHFGQSLDLSGDVLLVGSSSDGDLGEASGSAYLFRWDGSQWQQEDKILAGDGRDNDSFGVSVSLAGDLAVVGAEKSGGTPQRNGAIYIFRNHSGNWLQGSQIVASDALANDRFGSAVSTDGDVVVVGASSLELRRFVAYVYRRQPFSDIFVEEQKLAPSNGYPRFDHFGSRVAVDGDTLLVSAPMDKDQGYGTGAVHAWFFDGQVWGGEREFHASDPIANDQLGYGLALQGERAVVGNEPAAFPGRLARGYLFQVPELGLYASPRSLAEGEALTLSTHGGKPGAPVLVALVDLGGPLFVTQAVGSFDSEGSLELSGTIPVGLSGMAPVLQAFGIGPKNRVLASNREQVSIQ